MSSNIELRPARRNDAADLAILENIAGHGISQWFWQKAVEMGKATDAYDWGRSRMADDKALFGWSNSIIATCDGDIAGSANSYLMPDADPEEEKRNPPPFVPIFDLFNCAVGDWFVDSLAVYSQVRGQGVGGVLLDDCLARGRAVDAQRVSLVVEDANTAALALYHSRGFERRDSRPYITFGSASETKNWLLLSAPIK